MKFEPELGQAWPPRSRGSCQSQSQAYISAENFDTPTDPRGLPLDHVPLPPPNKATGPELTRGSGQEELQHWDGGYMEGFDNLTPGPALGSDPALDCLERTHFSQSSGNLERASVSHPLAPAAKVVSKRPKSRGCWSAELRGAAAVRPPPRSAKRARSMARARIAS